MAAAVWILLNEGNSVVNVSHHELLYVLVARFGLKMNAKDSPMQRAATATFQEIPIGYYFIYCAFTWSCSS